MTDYSRRQVRSCIAELRMIIDSTHIILSSYVPFFSALNKPPAFKDFPRLNSLSQMEIRKY